MFGAVREGEREEREFVPVGVGDKGGIGGSWDRVLVT